MLSIYRKELKLYFRHPGAFLPIAAILVVFGCLSVFVNFFHGYSDIAFPLAYLLPFLMATLPIPLLISGMREAKHEQFSFSLPISPFRAVLGKFLAAATLLLLPFLSICSVPLTLSFFGDVFLPVAYTSILGFLLLSLFFVALIQLLIALSPRLSVGVITVYATLVGIYLINILFSYIPASGALSALLSYPDPIDIFYSFTSGRLYLPGILYFLFTIALLLVFHTFVLKSHRGDLFAPSAKKKACAYLCSLLLLSVLANTTVTLLPREVTSPDISGSNPLLVSGKTKDLLHTLEEDVQIYYLCEGGVANVASDIFSFLEHYAEESDRIRIEVIDTEKDPTFIQAYGVPSVNNDSLVVQSEKRHFVLDSSTMFHYYNEDLQMNFSPSDYALCISSYRAYLESGSIEGLDTTKITYGQTLYYSTNTSAYFDGDSRLANAIKFVTEEEIPSVYVLQNESFTPMNSYFSALLTESSYFVKTVASAADVASDCSLLILYAPQKDVSEQEAAALRSYLSNGGKLFLVTSFLHTDLPNLLSVMDDYGLGVFDKQNYICEANTQYMLDQSVDYCFYNHIAQGGPTADFNDIFISILAHAITIEEKEGVVATPWLFTSEESYLKFSDDTEERVEGKRYNSGVTAEKGDSRVVWISSEDAVSSAGFSFSQGYNFALLAQTLSWLSPVSFQSLSIEPTPIPIYSVTMSNGVVAIWSSLLIAILPATFLLACFVVRYVRRKK